MSRRPPPAAGRAVPTGLGVVAAVALGSGAMLRDRVEWYDAYVNVLVSGLHARFPVHDARMLSNAGPYLGIAMVIGGEDAIECGLIFCPGSFIKLMAYFEHFGLSSLV